MRDISGTPGHGQNAARLKRTIRSIGALASAGALVLGLAVPAAAADVITVTPINDTNRLNHQEAVPYTFAVATFTDSLACSTTCQPASAYTVTITWDAANNRSTGNVTFVSQTGTAGNYSVTATHTYVDEFDCPSGTPCGYPINVSVVDTDGSSSPTNAGVIAVRDQLMSTIPTPTFAFRATAGAAFSGKIGSLQDANNIAVATDGGGTSPEYTATVNWGDGTPPDLTTATFTVGTCGASIGLGAGQGCPINASGTHTYAQPGTYPVTATVKDGRAPQSGSFASTAVVAGAGASACTSTSSTHWFAGCSNDQYAMKAGTASTWVPMDPSKLSITFNPTIASYAVISANADLWTGTAGFNQDIGIMVTGGSYPTTAGQPEVWKESGGPTIFAPNAAFAQKPIVTVPLTGGALYTVTLVWKASKPGSGVIWAGAGPISGNYSPTRLSVMLVPTAPLTTWIATSTQQLVLPNSNGTWQDMDATLSVQFTVPSTGSWLAYISGNADLWTSTLGFNQDIGINLVGGTYNGIVAWKESGGRAGTFSPNAAFVQPALPVTAGNYTAKLQWKANRAGTSKIYAGAGPFAGGFSPTTLSVVLIPVAGTQTASSTTQYQYTNSNGIAWPQMDNNVLKVTVTASSTANYLLAANSDLWTSTAGFNQDIGIMVSGGTIGAGGVVTWKESGGSASLAPNAAFVYGDVTLAASATPYTITIVWKANKPDSHTIYAGAGAVSPYSPTWLTATLLN